jgi:hypothetical protein
MTASLGKFQSKVRFLFSTFLLLISLLFTSTVQAQWAAMATADISNFFKRQYEKTHGHGDAYNASGSHIVILHAMWGEGTNWANVTARIDPAKYCSDPYAVQMSTRPPNVGGSRCNIPLEWNLLGDPSPGQDKALRVLFTCVYPGLSLPYLTNAQHGFLDPKAEFREAYNFDTSWRLDPEMAKTMNIGCLPQHRLNAALNNDPNHKKMKDRWSKYLGRGWNCDLQDCNMLRRNFLPVKSNEFFVNIAQGFNSWQDGQFSSPPQNGRAFVVRDPANYNAYKRALEEAGGDHTKVDEILQVNRWEQEAVKHDRLQPHNQERRPKMGLSVQ